jgi:hypothetical protein
MFIGLPYWLWAVLIAVVLIALRVRDFYTRYRGMCRGIREDLTEQLHQKHPNARVLREQMGNLVVRLPDGSEKIWEMAEIYTRVMQLPGMGRDPAARTAIYRDAVAGLFAPDPAAPISLATHGDRVKPLIVPTSALSSDPNGGELVHAPVPGLGLSVFYVLELALKRRPVTEEDRQALGLDRGALHQRALENLREDFPPDLVTGALAGDGATASQMADGYDAARILLIPGILKPGETLLALIPHRDMLVLLPPSMEEDPAKLNESIQLLTGEHSEQCSHPHLLDHAVRITHAGFEAI